MIIIVAAILVLTSILTVILSFSRLILCFLAIFIRISFSLLSWSLTLTTLLTWSILPRSLLLITLFVVKPIIFSLIWAIFWYMAYLLTNIAFYCSLFSTVFVCMSNLSTIKAFNLSLPSLSLFRWILWLVPCLSWLLRSILSILSSRHCTTFRFLRTSICKMPWLFAIKAWLLFFAISHMMS